MIREIVSDVLEGADFDVLYANSTQAAFQALDGSARIVAAFLDVDLGDQGGGGYLVARHGRASRPDLTVIYTSGGSQENFARERVTGGVFVPKPYLPSRVLTMIQDAVRGAESRPH
jgi:DNA-binding NtrC family response regulator